MTTKTENHSMVLALRILATGIHKLDPEPARYVFAAAKIIEQLTDAIHQTLMENLHLADGEECTLKRLKDAICFELPAESAAEKPDGQPENVQGDGSPDEKSQPTR